MAIAVGLPTVVAEVDRLNRYRQVRKILSLEREPNAGLHHWLGGSGAAAARRRSGDRIPDRPRFDEGAAVSCRVGPSVAACILRCDFTLEQKAPYPKPYPEKGNFSQVLESWPASRSSKSEGVGMRTEGQLEGWLAKP